MKEVELEEQAAQGEEAEKRLVEAPREAEQVVKQVEEGCWLPPCSFSSSGS